MSLPTDKFEPEAVFEGISGEEALRSIAISLKRIADVMETGIAYAGDHPELRFKVTRVGCGLAGLRDQDIAPMFMNVGLGNLWFDSAWMPILGPLYKYWGTY